MYHSEQDQGRYFHRVQDRRYGAPPAGRGVTDTPAAAHLPPQVYASAHTFLPSQVSVHHQQTNLSLLYRAKIGNRLIEDSSSSLYMSVSDVYCSCSAILTFPCP